MNSSLPIFLLLVAIAAIVAFISVRWRRRASGRQRAMQRLLDAADRLEARLRTARSEIAAVAGDDVPDPVQDAMLEMLRQRIWLREHGQRATIEELHEVRGSIETAGARIEQQLLHIHLARTALE